MRQDSINTLVLYADYTTRLSYYDDWLDAFKSSTQFRVTPVNICSRGDVVLLKQSLPQAELVVLLHSTNGDTTIYLEPLISLLQSRRGLLLSFVGNEVNLPGSPIRAKRQLFSAIEPDFIATQLSLDAGVFLFGDLARRRVISVPHALNPTVFRPLVPDETRVIDIGVISVRYIAHLGDNDRNRLYDYFDQHGEELGLRVDIGTQRLNRKGWVEFLNKCKATISSEAGSWYLERDDHTVDAIRAWTDSYFSRRKLVIRNDSPLRRWGHKLPWPVRAMLRTLLSKGPLRHEVTLNEQLPFDLVYEQFFRDYARPHFYGKCISSRHFDAIGTKSCQIMFPGRYNDILKADEHYIALRPDFSNIGDVITRFQDTPYRQAMLNRTYEYAMDAHTLRHRIATLCEAVAADHSSR